MFNISFRGARLPLLIASAGLGLMIAGCGGGGTNLPTPGSGNGGLGTAGGTGGGGGFQLGASSIVFVSTRDGNPEIYSLDLNGTAATNARRLTNNAAIDEQPSRSPDGRTIVFFSQRDGNAEIYKMNTDGSGLVRLTSDTPAADAPRDTNPVFSPDGTKIVWQSTRAATQGGPIPNRLYIMDASGANQRPVVFGDSAPSALGGSWNPDSTRLLGLLNNSTGASDDLVVITPGNGTTTPATANIIRANIRSFHARYSPAGERIVLANSFLAGPGSLQLLHADGTLIGEGPSGGVGQNAPSFNPAGTRLVWDASAAEGQARQLYVSDVVASGTQPTGVAITTQGENYDASWTQ